MTRNVSTWLARLLALLPAFAISCGGDGDGAGAQRFPSRRCGANDTPANLDVKDFSTQGGDVQVVVEGADLCTNDTFTLCGRWETEDEEYEYRILRTPRTSSCQGRRSRLTLTFDSDPSGGATEGNGCDYPEPGVVRCGYNDG